MGPRDATPLDAISIAALKDKAFVSYAAWAGSASLRPRKSRIAPAIS
jgi:hypothetical protein